MLIYGEPEPNKTIKQLISEGFTFTMTGYPIFDASYRAGLNQKILDHYRFHEICEPVSSDWLFLLNRTLNETMPYFNQLYVSAATSINPLVSFSRTEAENIASEGASTGTTTGTMARQAEAERTAATERAESASDRNYGKTVESDTPPGLLTMSDIEGNVYASRAAVNDDRNTRTGTVHNEDTADERNTENATTEATTAQSGTGTTARTRTETGHDVPLAELVKLHRETFLNIDMMVVRAVSDCFIQCY